MFETWLSCLEHEIHVQNMKVMFGHVPEHDNHVWNMTVMFQNMRLMLRTWSHDEGHVWSCSIIFRHVFRIVVMFRTWISCLEHDNHVSIMKVMFSHVQSCSKTKSIFKIPFPKSGIEHPRICFEASSTNHCTNSIPENFPGKRLFIGLGLSQNSRI